MTTRLVVLSDTHLARGIELPRRLTRAIADTDVVIHLGDFTGTDLANELESTGKLVAVHGNCDVTAIRNSYPTRRDLVVEGKVIRCIHGDVGGRTADAAAAAERDADVVLYGHSHMPKIRKEDGVLLFNPGSPTQKRFARYPSYGILEIGEEIEARIVPLDPSIDAGERG
jgi:putative phosphoesterase